MSFSDGDIATWKGEGFDVVFSNAALHWVPDHEGVLRQWAAALRPHGQLAVQVPANADHPSHTVLREVAVQWLGHDAPPDPVERNVLGPAAYAALLHEIGFEQQLVRSQLLLSLRADPLLGSSSWFGVIVGGPGRRGAPAAGVVGL